MSTDVELVVNGKCELGEGPIWDDRAGRLWWLNILAKELHQYDPATKQDRVLSLPQMPGTVVGRASGGLMLALENGFAAYDPETERLEMLVDPEADKPGNRFNDGKCDPAGRFVAGTMQYDAAEPDGALYTLDLDGTVRKLEDHVYCSNGLAWSEDGKTMYYIDSMCCRVDAFDYDVSTGTIANRRPVVEIPKAEGLPDGMTIDVDDNIWVAHFGGGCVSHWDPRTGRRLGELRLPVTNITACWFGGADLEDLYITTAFEGMSEEERAANPESGGLYLSRPGVRGRPAVLFGG